MTNIDIDRDSISWLIFRPGESSPLVRIAFFHLFDPKEIIDSEDHMQALAACYHASGPPSPEEEEAMRTAYPQLPKAIDHRCYAYIATSDWIRSDEDVVEGLSRFDSDEIEWGFDGDDDEDEYEEIDGYVEFEPNEEKVGRPKRKIVF